MTVLHGPPATSTPLGSPAMSDPTIADAVPVVGTVATGPPRLTFTDVGKTFPDGTEALAGVSFSVSSGEFVTVVGPSGCGKSTLLRLASGLDHETAGSVDVDRSNVGYV